MRIARLAIAPVKGLGLVHPQEVLLGRTGVRNDRRFYLVDPDGRLVNNKTCGELMQVRPGVSPDADRLTLAFPSGETVGGDVELGAAVETSFYGRPVTGRYVDGTVVGRDQRARGPAASPRADGRARRGDRPRARRLADLGRLAGGARPQGRHRARRRPALPHDGRARRLRGARGGLLDRRRGRGRRSPHPGHRPCRQVRRDDAEPRHRRSRTSTRSAVSRATARYARASRSAAASAATCSRKARSASATPSCEGADAGDRPRRGSRRSF